jgi:hypothetical protein
MLWEDKDKVTGTRPLYLSSGGDQEFSGVWIQ